MDELELGMWGGGREIDQLLRDLAVSAAGVGVFDWDLATGALLWDERLLALFEYDRASFGATIEAFNDRVHPDDLPRVSHALTEAIATCGEYEAEYRLVLPSGRIRWVGARGRALAGGDGRAARVIGAAYDVTVHREGDARVVEVLESMPTAFLSLDHAWRFAYVNAEAEKLLGLPREDLLGRVLWELFPAAIGSDFDAHYRRAMSERVPVAFDAYYPEPLHGWYEVRAWPSPTGLSVYFLEVTARRQAQEQAAAAAARAALLAEITRQLAETLDAHEAVARLARLLVPALADWCLVTLVDADAPRGDWRRTLADLAWNHRDPALQPVVTRYASTRLAVLRDDAPVAQALHRARPVVIPTGALDRLLATLGPGPAREAITRLAPGSAVIVPLRGRDRTVGLVSLYSAPERPPLDDQDLATVLDVAARAGLTLDNARLYAQQRQLAEQLQRALLTDPPRPEHLQLAVRYEPAAQAAQIGGDWYDAFTQPDGVPVVVIGDVVGHDSAAAAAMGQIRGLLRGIAARDTHGPAEVLRELDQVLRTLQIDVTATAVVARVERPEPPEQGAVLRWSNAGHPPPLLITPEGQVTALESPPPGTEPDLLLGVDPTGRRVEGGLTLPVGTTVLLYTDGLIERRDQPFTTGLARLRDTLAQLAHLPLDDLCDQVLTRLLPAAREDDVALLAVRVHPR